MLVFQPASFSVVTHLQGSSRLLLVVAAGRQWHILGVKQFIDLCHPHSISHLLAIPRPTSDQILIGKYSFRIVMSSHATIHVASELNTTSMGRLVNQISQEHVMLDLFDTNYRCPSIWPKWRKVFLNLILNSEDVLRCVGFYIPDNQEILGWLGSCTPRTEGNPEGQGTYYTLRKRCVWNTVPRECIRKY